MKRKGPTQFDATRKLHALVSRAPEKPGVYRWLNGRGEILYVGKAKNLRNRLRNYTQKKDNSLGPWKQALLTHIADLDYIVTKNDLEALILETSLIKEHRPKYNVMMKDDKNYVYVRITVDDRYPSVTVVRRMEEDTAKYFGPFLSARSIHHTLDMLQTIYNYRACKRSIELFNRNPHAQCKPCIESQIRECNGLCTGRVTQKEYSDSISAVVRFFRGERQGILAKIQETMKSAAMNKKFEQAAKLRDTLQYLQSIEQQQVVSDTSGANTDVYGIALLSQRAHVVLLQERNGKVIGEMHFALDGKADTPADVLEQFLPQYYEGTQDIPETILLRETFGGKETLEEWFSGHRGKRVAIAIPERGKKSKLLKMAEENAREKVQQQFAKWEAEGKRRETALEELKQALTLKDLPYRIECYDISHLSGTETVGSMVVFVGGKPKNDHYRSFTIRTMKKGEVNDYKALREVLSRRLQHLQQWKDQGISFGRAQKGEQETLEEILAAENGLSVELIDYRNFIVARKAGHIVSFGQLITHEGSIKEIRSLWVSPTFFGWKILHALLQKLMTKTKKGKVYVITSSSLTEFYAQCGFRPVHTPPRVLQEKMEKLSADQNNPTLCTIMMCDSQRNKPDPSLTTVPDLLVIDGGKGQLSIGQEVLRAMRLTIPVIALAKREEEVFAEGKRSPLHLQKHSEARFLLMRMRDEAHRFANMHREKRLKNALFNL